MERISAAKLDDTLRSSPYLLLDFSSPGCAPCKGIAQGLPALLDELLPIALQAYEVDVTTDPAIAARFFVLGVPTLILFREGREIGRFNSLPKADRLRRLLS